ncbi:MAG: hypothetical protein AAB622_00350 [Patescibacteria group bacterium]
MSEIEAKLAKNPLIYKLLSLHLLPEDYAVFGSGPMFAHGIKESVRDLDVIARGKAWEKARQLGKTEETKLKFGSVITLFGGEIEIYDSWVPAGKWDIDRLIGTSDVMGGIRFVKLEDVLRWKRMRNSLKDIEHIKLIENYFANNL